MASLDYRMVTLAALALLVPAAASADTKAVYESAKGDESLTFSVKGPMVRWEASEFKKDGRYALYDGTRRHHDPGRRLAPASHRDGSRDDAQAARGDAGPARPDDGAAQEADEEHAAGAARDAGEAHGRHHAAGRRRGQARPSPPRRSAAAASTASPASASPSCATARRCTRSAWRRAPMPGMPRADYDTMIKMFDTMRNMASAVASTAVAIPADLKGMPVEMKDYTNGTAQTLKSISTATLAVRRLPGAGLQESHLRRSDGPAALAGSGRPAPPDFIAGRALLR